MPQHEHGRHDDEGGTDTHPEFRMCVFHLDHESKLRLAEKNAENLWKAINTMRAWVIAGCGAMIMCLVGVLAQLVAK